MDYAKYQFILSLFNSVLSLAAMFYAWWATRVKVIRSRFRAQDEKFEALGKEVAELRAKNPAAHCTGHADLAQKQTDLAQKQTAQVEKQSQFEKLLTTVETELKHLPTVRDIEKLYENLNGVRNQVSNLANEVNKIAGAMPGVTHLTEMMNEFLLNHGEKR